MSLIGSFVLWCPFKYDPVVNEAFDVVKAAFLWGLGWVPHFSKIGVKTWLHRE